VYVCGEEKQQRIVTRCENIDWNLNQTGFYFICAERKSSRPSEREQTTREREREKERKSAAGAAWWADEKLFAFDSAQQLALRSL